MLSRVAGVMVLASGLVCVGCSREPEGPERIIHSPSKEEFAQVLKENAVVLVDFQADWCGPCQEMKPIVRQLEKKYRNRVAVVEVDIDRRPDIAREFGVKSIPHFFIVRNGEPVRALNGKVSRGELDMALRQALGD